MLNLINFLLISSFLSLSVAQKLMVCYYGSWASYRNGDGKCSASNLDPFVCTHLIYSFVGLNNDGTIRINDPWLDLPDNGGLDNIGQFNKLKTINPNLKTLVAIGGWNEGSGGFSRMANDPNLRAKFVKEAASFTMKYGFNGFDVDWEYPGQRDSPNGARDIAAFTQLLMELRTEFNKYGLLLTAAVAAAQYSAQLSYNIPEISKYLNFIHIMSYDFHGAWESNTGHNAGMNDVDAAYKYWLSQGAPKEKIVMGVPLYGHTFKLSNPQSTSVGAPTIKGQELGGQYSLSPGFIGLNELCEKRQTEFWPEVLDTNAKVPYTYKGSDWISYENLNSLQTKAQYAMSQGFAGVMVWSIETDDFRGKCYGEKFAFIRAITKIFGQTVVTNAPVTIPPTTKAPITIAPTTSPNICTKEGYVRDRNDCSVFYNCVKTGTNTYILYRFQCPASLYFDLTVLVCNWPQLVSCP